MPNDSFKNNKKSEYVLLNFMNIFKTQICSVQSLSHVWLWPHGLQHTRLPCPSRTPRACSNSCPLSQWCHPTISSSCRLLLLLPSILPSIRILSNESVLCIRRPKYWSFGFSISPSNEFQGWFLLGQTNRISLQSKGLLRDFCNITVQKHQFFSAQLSFHTWLLEKP